MIDISTHVKIINNTCVFHRYDFKDMSLDVFTQSIELLRKQYTINNWIIDFSLDAFDCLPAPIDQNRGFVPNEEYGLINIFEICAVKFGSLAQPYHIIHADYDITSKYSAWQKAHPTLTPANSTHFNAIFFDIYVTTVPNNKLIINDNSLNQRDYCVFVNRHKDERQQLLVELNRQQKLDNIYCSWNWEDTVWQPLNISDQYRRNTPILTKDTAENMIWPGNGSVDDSSIVNTYAAVNAELVAETMMQNRFITEKTVRPLVWGLPFLVLAAPGHLNMLRQLGFETFPELWDEHYDSTVDLNARINAIVSQMHTVDKNLVKSKLAHNRHQAFKLAQTYSMNAVAHSLA